MIKYNKNRQQWEAWYINWLEDPIMVAAIWEGASSASIAPWKEHWERRTRELENLHDLIRMGYSQPNLTL